ncbi:MAG: SRPBCC domain-containing protein [Chloroflexota bacterium]
MSDQPSVVIERTLDAPIDLVWKMWTESEHFSSWYGPMGMTIPVAKMDVQVGGKRHICMEMNSPERQMKMWLVGEYIEITPVTRLVYTEAMSDEDGNVLSPAAMGMPEGSPESTQVVVELEDLDGSTKMTMTHVGVPADSPGAGGWRMAFDKMAEYLASF